MYVVVPKAFIDRAFDIRWSELVEMAEFQKNGLRTSEIAHRYRPRRGDGEWEEGWDDWDAIAFVRPGDGEYSGKAFLYQQNW